MADSWLFDGYNCVHELFNERRVDDFCQNLEAPNRQAPNGHSAKLLVHSVVTTALKKYCEHQQDFTRKT